MTRRAAVEDDEEDSDDLFEKSEKPVEQKEKPKSIFTDEEK